MRKLLFFILSSVAVFAATVFFRLGGHKPVALNLEERTEMHFLYKEHFGAYHKINDVLTQVEAYAAKNNIPCPQTFGEYLDDPRMIEERRLRSNGGCVLTATAGASDGYLYKTIPARQWLVAKFEGAPSIGPMKVYPKAEEYMKEHGFKLSGPVIEVYTVKGAQEARTEYLFPVEKSTP
jgi:effector-binding domain-containing protein